MAFSQEAHVFKLAFKQNAAYQTQVSNIGLITVNVDADEEMKAQLAAAGQTFPMKMEMNQLMESTLTTSQKTDEGLLPAVVSYDKMDMEQSMNGQPIATGTTNPMLGAKVVGQIDGQQFMINAVEGENVTPQIEQMVKSTVEKLFDVVKFPDYALKIGDQFVVDIPFSLPVMGKTMEIDISTTYTLKEVKNELATFIVAQVIELNTDMDGVALAATGEGVGSLIFNMKTNYYDSYQTDMKMKMKMNIPVPNNSMKMNMVMDMKSLTTNTIKSK
jgi:hypothetical protein